MDEQLRQSNSSIQIEQVDLSLYDKFISQILLKEWKPEPGEEDFTIMKVIVRERRKKNRI